MTPINVCILPRSQRHDPAVIEEIESILERFFSDRAGLKTEAIKHELFERLK